MQHNYFDWLTNHDCCAIQHSWHSPTNTIASKMSLGFTLWSLEDGFVDAMVRGWRSTFLTDLEYTNLKEG